MAAPMLEKLRSRHPIDVPADEWKRSRGLLGALGTILVLFLLVPLGLVAYAAIKDRSFLLGAGAAVGAFLLMILVYAARGKPGHARR